MRWALEYAFYIGSFVCAVVDANTVPKGVVKLDTKHKFVLPRASKKSKRGTTVSSSIPFNDHWVPQGGYFIDVDVGTPPQKFELLVDTGSANLYVPSSKAATCQQYLCPGGSYNTADSSTFANVKTPAPLRLAYADGSTVNGTYVSDTVTLAGDKMTKFVFAIANELQVSPSMTNGPQYGIMGVSYMGAESSICAIQTSNGSCNANFTTPTMWSSLYNGGYIKSRSYSLYLDDVAAQSGSILFGGIDTAKFIGKLTTLGVPVDTNQQDIGYGLDVYQALYITSVSGKMNGKSATFTPSNYSTTTLLDSGNPNIGLPYPIYTQVLQAFQTLPLSTLDYNIVIACSDAAKVDASLTIGVTGTNGQSVSIEIPFMNFIVPLYSGSYNSTTPLQQGGKAMCSVNVYNAGNGSYVSALGDPFLRSAYGFFDLDARTISLAQLSYDATGSSITSVGPSGAPSATGSGKTNTPSPVSPAATSTSTSKSGAAAVSGNIDSLSLYAMFSTVLMVGYLW